MAEFLTEGFRNIANLWPEIVGQPIENEHWEANGDSIQGTTNGILVYRKSSNTPAFTSGAHTWLWGPNGPQDRDNNVRFPWEPDYVPPASVYAPRVISMPLASLSERYAYLRTPLGFLLHGTRSSVSRPAAEEFPGAAQYEMNRDDGEGAVCTIGDDAIAQHLPWSEWCWHARGASRYYVGCEFAQGTAGDEITDAQVRAFCAVVQKVRKVYPGVPLAFPTHAELDGTAIYGPYHDGKTDVFPRGDPRTDELRSRIIARLKEIGIAT